MIKNKIKWLAAVAAPALFIQLTQAQTVVQNPNSQGVAAIFDGSGKALSVEELLQNVKPAAIPAAQQVAQQCTPGVDCPSQPQSPNQPSCTPGVDCPGSGSGSSNCTPGVDCPGSGSSNGSGTPLPPNYQPRPAGPPPSFPPVPGNAPYNNSGVDVTGYWHTYYDVFGSPEEAQGNWSNNNAQVIITRGGSEVGTEAKDYTVSLQSTPSRDIYRLYWRYVGSDCDPNNYDDCVHWDIEYAYFYDHAENGQSSNMFVDVKIENAQGLLPWEKEIITINYDGSRLSVDTSQAIYQYDVQGPIIDQQNGKAYFTLTSQSKNMTAPEADKVKLWLQVDNGQLFLMAEDDRASYYNGQTIEFSQPDLQVGTDKKGFLGIHYTSWQKIAIPPSVLQHMVKENSTNPRIDIWRVRDLSQYGQNNKYRLRNWSFRRPDGKISSTDWVNEYANQTLQY